MSVNFANFESCAVVVGLESVVLIGVSIATVVVISGESSLLGRVVSGESTSGLVVGETGFSVVVVARDSSWMVVRESGSTVVVSSGVSSLTVVGEACSSVVVVCLSIVIVVACSGVAGSSVVVAVGDSIGSGVSIFMIGSTDN